MDSRNNSRSLCEVAIGFFPNCGIHHHGSIEGSKDEKNLSTPLIEERHSPLYTDQMGHSPLCLEKTLSPLYREGVCLLYR